MKFMRHSQPWRVNGPTPSFWAAIRSGSLRLHAVRQRDQVLLRRDIDRKLRQSRCM